MATDLRSTNADITSLALRDLRSFWSSLDLGRPEAARNQLLRFTPQLVAKYGEIAATVAADWYDDLRFEADVPGRFAAEMADVASSERVAARARYAAGHLFTENPEATLALLDGAVQKYVLEPSRNTIVRSVARDPKATGWARHTRADGCDFCRFLAQRGAVYKEATARFASHDDCNCTSAPSWDPDAPEVDVKAYVASRRTSTMSPAERDEHNARARDWINAYIT